MWPPYEPLPPLDRHRGADRRAGRRDDHQPPDHRRQDRQLSPRPAAVGARPGRRDHRGERRGRHPIRRALPHPVCPTASDPVRSARTGDLDLLARMNRPILAWSGGNPGVTRWIESAASSGVLVNFTAQKNRCYTRAPRAAVHRTTCSSTRRARSRTHPTCRAGPSALGDRRRLDDPRRHGHHARHDVRASTMDGVDVDWTWDAGKPTYLRSQNGEAHLHDVRCADCRRAPWSSCRTFHAPSPVDGRSPNPITTGGGTTAVVHRGGVAYRGGLVSRDGLRRVHLRRRARPDRSVPLDTGTTFVELAPRPLTHRWAQTPCAISRR